MFKRALQFCFCLTLLTGCQSKYANLPTYQPASQPVAASGLSDPIPFPSVNAIVAPPIGWVADTVDSDNRYTHQVWRSPSGSSAYGVIHFGIPFLPLPASL